MVELFARQVLDNDSNIICDPDVQDAAKSWFQCRADSTLGAMDCCVMYCTSCVQTIPVLPTIPFCFRRYSTIHHCNKWKRHFRLRNGHRRSEAGFTACTWRLYRLWTRANLVYLQKTCLTGNSESRLHTFVKKPFGYSIIVVSTIVQR